MTRARLTAPQVHVMVSQLRALEIFKIATDDVVGVFLATTASGQVVFNATRTETFNVWDVEYHPALWTP